MRLEGKVCLVAGAGGALGRAICLEFGRQGASVLATDLAAGPLAQTEVGVKETGARVAAVAGDLTDSAFADDVVASALRTFGRVDVLVNAQGMSDATDTKVTEVTDAVFARTIAVNAGSVFRLCRAAVPAMRAQRGGSIINVASLGALKGYGGFAYTASKGAVAALTRQLGYQEAGAGIRCNSILPGAIDTPMVPNAKRKVGLEPSPLFTGGVARLGTPQEVAYLCVYLASDESAYVNASSFSIDGGAAQH